MNLLTQKFGKQFNYEQISKEEDNDHEKKIALDNVILRLKRNNRELIRMKMKL